MTAPPARPHIIAAPRHHSFNTSWADEDDAWDSGSDKEDSRPAPAYSQSRPIPVKPRAPARQSTNGVAFSFTYVSPPSPSSYAGPVSPLQQAASSPNQPSQSRAKSSWTIVRKQSDDKASQRSGDSPAPQTDVDVEDMIIPGDELDQHAHPPDSQQPFASRSTPIIKPQAEDIVSDPFRIVGGGGGSMRNGAESAPMSRQASYNGMASTTSLTRDRSIRSNRKNKIVDCLLAEHVHLADLRKIAWSGIPDDVRPVAWQLLLGYLPLARAAQAAALARKREEYASLVRLTFARGRDGLDQQIWHQIEIDVPRTRPGVRLWMEASTQRCLERILYVWAIRHPASGYVQGINDLATPFFQVFLSAYIDSDPELLDPSLLPPSVLSAVEADTFWCLSRLLDGIQDNYISHQPGIHRSVKRMADLVARIDAPLVEHLRKQGVEFMQFAFRWMNCLLMREISVRNTIRMWDTYLSEGPDAFSQFHLYVCCAFLVKWSDKLRKMDFQGIIMFLQSLPTQGWTDHDIQLLLSEAFVLSNTWQNAQSHFT